jgi:AcrR family transcriptional regulator
MGDVNDPESRYVSPLRAQQAANTRRAVLTAAHELFIAQGYGATTIDQIAAAAGVSKPTVFTAVGNKRTLLSVVRNVAIAGDDQPVSVGERSNAEEIFAEPDPYRAVTLLARFITDMASRYAEIDQVLRGAASSGEAGLLELWETSERQRLEGARLWVTTLARKGQLREDLDLDTAIDLMWLHMAVDLYYRLVHVRGWTRDRYENWLADNIARLLAPVTP